MARKVHTDSEALYAIRSAISKFNESFQEAQGSFSQCFEQMNYQVEGYIRKLESNVEFCKEEKHALQRKVEEIEEQLSKARKEHSQHVEIQQLEDKKKQLQERFANLDEYTAKQESTIDRLVQNYSELQFHQQYIMDLLVFGDGEDPETVIAFIDKALGRLSDYQAVNFEAEGSIECKENPTASSNATMPQTMIRDEYEAVAAGMQAIDSQMDAVRDDCRDKGILDPSTIESIVDQKREEAEIEFYDDYFGKVDEKALAAFTSLSSFFSEQAWATLNENEREKALNTLAINIGKAYRTEINGVAFFDAPPDSRGYYSGDGYLYLNSDCLTDAQNRVDALDTIFHEGRHAFQHAAIKDPHRFGITIYQANLWDDNFRHYLRSERFGYDRYYSQPVEADAFSFAEHIITSGGIQ